MTAYCTVPDLLVGDTRLPAAVDPQQYINAAADEIDGGIGGQYITPISIDDSPQNRSSMLLLKTINIWLASGRILLTISRSGEDGNLDALGRYYVNSALARINDIASGKIDLIGAVKSAEARTFKGPTAVNGDEGSLVDAFYGHFQRPALPYGLGILTNGDGVGWLYPRGD